MKKTRLLGLLAVVAAVSQASAVNGLLNGDWASGTEANWTRWRAPWGLTENWKVDGDFGYPPPAGTLYGGGGNGNFGWYQVVAAPLGSGVTLSGDWAGDIGGAGWAQIMLCSSSDPNADWAVRLDTGAAADIAFKKDSWGMNPPTTWDWQPAMLSPHPGGNGGHIISQGYVCVGLVLGGFPCGSASFDNLVLAVIPEPSTALLLLVGVSLLYRRRV